MKKKTDKKIITPEFDQVISLISEARNRAFSKVNEELVLLYFNVGKIVSERVNEGAWGDRTVDELVLFIGKKIPGLTAFNRRGLYRMKQFYETYSESEFIEPLYTLITSHLLPQNEIVSAKMGVKEEKPKKDKKAVKASKSKELKKKEIVSALRTQSGKKDKNEFVSALRTQIEDIITIQDKFVRKILIKINWTNHRLILSKTRTPEEKFYYLLETIREKYSSRELERALDTSQFERAMISNKSRKKTQIQLPENLFRDPYIFEFLNLPELHSEDDLEKALIKNLQKFISEIGKGFSYMGNQFRLQVGNKDYYSDLLFFHRDLQCLVLFELKIEEFQPEFLGKLNFYLEALDRDVKRVHENPSIGVLLCKGKDTEVVEYAMARNTSPALIAEYKMKLIDKKILANKLHQLASELSKKTQDDF